MNDRQNRIHQMSIRSREFLKTRLGDFSPDGMVQQLNGRLVADITKLETQSASQASGVADARQGTRTIGDARQALRQSLVAINRAARAMGMEDRFPLPPQGNDRKLIQAGRAAAIDAMALNDEFLLHEMPGSFVNDLRADVADLETAIAARDGAVDDHVSAGAGIDDTCDELLETVNSLGGLVKNKYADNPAVLAEWLAASHIERAPRRQPPPSPPPAPPPPVG